MWVKATAWSLLCAVLLAGCVTTGSRSSHRGSTGSKKKARKVHTASTEASSNVPETHKPRKTRCQLYLPTIEKYAREHNLEVELVMGVIKVESSFNPELESRVGATGLMQVMPRTGQHMECGSDLHDPETNIACGCKVLRKYIDRYGGNLVYGLSAYNTGPGNTNKYSKDLVLPFNFSYVEKVLRWRNVFVRYGCR
jgi:soluble lytic murein transglycosylase-like protein